MSMTSLTGTTTGTGARDRTGAQTAAPQSTPRPERRLPSDAAQQVQRGPAPAPLPKRADGRAAAPATGPLHIISGRRSAPAPSAGSAQRDDSWREDYVARLRWVDAVAILLTLLAAQLVRFGPSASGGGLELGALSIDYVLVGLALGITWWCWLELRGARAVRLIGYGMEEAREVFAATLTLFSAVAIVSYALSVPVARGYVLVALPVGLLLLTLGRFVLRARLMRRRRQGEAMARTMVVGRQRGALETAESLLQHDTAGLQPVATYFPPSRTQPSDRLQQIEIPNALPEGEDPTVAGILEATHRYDIETLVLANSSPLSSTEIRHLSWYLADARVRLVMNTGLTDIAGPRIHTQQIAGLPLIHVATPRLTWSRRMAKRAMDIAGALFALVVLSPIMAIVALAVKVHDRGPIIFRQERVGLDGQPFQMLKFRSMYTDAEERKAALAAVNESGGDVLFKMKDDPRVTRPGRVIRRYSLDELPQFVNVLRGEMSLVGPRPPLEAEVSKYEDYVHRRLRVKPGITGLWQVSGRSDLDWDQAVRLDLYYVENWSVLEDVLILLRTVKAVFAHEGAY